MLHISTYMNHIQSYQNLLSSEWLSIYLHFPHSISAWYTFQHCMVFFLDSSISVLSHSCIWSRVGSLSDICWISWYFFFYYFSFVSFFMSSKLLKKYVLHFLFTFAQKWNPFSVSPHDIALSKNKQYIFSLYKECMCAESNT